MIFKHFFQLISNQIVPITFNLLRYTYFRELSRSTKLQKGIRAWFGHLEIE